MTDGVQRVVGVEDRPIESLQVLSPAGLKVLIANVDVRYGCLLLVPEGLKVLGGMVKSLEAKHKKLVKKVVEKVDRERTWYDQTIDSGASSVGDFAVADNSIWLEAIQGSVLERMDGAPLVPIIKEVAFQEGDAVHKKQNAVLGKKQLDGQQTEMAGVPNAEKALNTAIKAVLQQLSDAEEAFLENCVHKADTIRVTFSNQLQHLQDIWDEAGECEGKREDALLEIERELVAVADKVVNGEAGSAKASENAFMGNELLRACLESCERQVSKAKKSKDKLERELKFVKEETSRLASILGVEDPVVASNGLQANKKEGMSPQFGTMVRELERLEALREEREKKFADVQSQIQRIRGEIDGNSNLTKQDPAGDELDELRSRRDYELSLDLSLNKLEELEFQLKQLEQIRGSHS